MNNRAEKILELFLKIRDLLEDIRDRHPAVFIMVQDDMDNWKLQDRLNSKFIN